MFHDNEEMVGTALLDDAALRQQLALLAAGLDARFVRAGETLATAIMTIDRVIAGLDAVTAALDPQRAGAAVGNLRQVAEQLVELPVAQAARGADTLLVTQTAARLQAQVMDMRQMLHVLGIYGMNIKIAASGEPHFVSFVDGMATRLVVGGQELNGILAKLKELVAGVADVRQTDRLLAAECTKILPHVPAKLVEDAAALDRHLGGVGALAVRVATIARRVQGQVAVVLGALQVGDSTRQRIEHVVASLQMTEGSGLAPDGGAAGHVYRLIAAQIEAATRDFVAGTETMLTSLGELGPATAGLVSLIDEQAGAEGRPFLARLEESIGDAERVTMQLREVDNRSAAMTGEISGAVGELAGRLHSIQRIKLEVQDISTNTRLLCRRHGSIGKAVSVIATEVDTYATTLGGLTTDVDCTIRDLGDINRAIRERAGGRDGQDMGRVLAGALGVIREACRQTDQVVMQGGDDARQLLDLLDRTSAELSAEMALGGALETATTTLRLRAIDPAIDDAEQEALRTLLSTIAPLYTMAQERDVHAEYLLPGMEQAVAVQSDDDDDDDGLF